MVGDPTLPSWPLAFSCVSFPLSLHPISIYPLKDLVLSVDSLYTFIPVMPRALPPPCTMPPIFVDAAPFHRGSSLISLFRPHPFATTVQSPPWVLSQQDAELYAIFHAIHQAHLIKLSHVCIYTDNFSAFFTLISGRVPSTQPTRARILRRIYRMCITNDIKFQLVRLPSKLNPSDLYSRPHLLARTPKDFHPFFLHTHTSYTYSAASPPIWHRRLHSSFPLT